MILTSQQEEFLKIVRQLEALILADKVEWIALSLRTTSDVAMTIHTEGAPKRPKGLI